MIYLLTGIYCIRQAPFHPVILLRFVRMPYSETARKQMNGSMNEAFTAGSHATRPRSIMAPCSGGISAPPTIAITSPAAPSVESSPSPFSAIPYMVGNISDMKMEVATRQ